LRRLAQRSSNAGRAALPPLTTGKGRQRVFTILGGDCDPSPCDIVYFKSGDTVYFGTTPK